MKLKVQYLYADAQLPVYAEAGDSGVDVFSRATVTLIPWEPATFPLGLAFEPEAGWELQVRPRSSMSRRGIICHFGTVDGGYRGEVSCVLHNLRGGWTYTIQAGDKIAQLVPAMVEPMQLEVVEHLSPSARGTRGWGSSGR